MIGRQWTKRHIEELQGKGGGKTGIVTPKPFINDNYFYLFGGLGNYSNLPRDAIAWDIRSYLYYGNNYIKRVQSPARGGSYFSGRIYHLRKELWKDGTPILSGGIINNNVSGVIECVVATGSFTLELIKDYRGYITKSYYSFTTNDDGILFSTDGASGYSIPLDETITDDGEQVSDDEKITVTGKAIGIGCLKSLEKIKNETFTFYNMSFNFSQQIVAEKYFSIRNDGKTLFLGTDSSFVFN